MDGEDEGGGGDYMDRDGNRKDDGEVSMKTTQPHKTGFGRWAYCVVVWGVSGLLLAIGVAAVIGMVIGLIKAIAK